MNIQVEPAALGNWSTRTYHRRWLLDQADALFNFFQYRAVNPKGGFYDMDDYGKPLDKTNPVRGIHLTARMVHCFSIGSLLGRPGANEIVDHGMNYLWNHHRDTKHGGYVWSLNNDGPVDSSKQGYGHAFVLLAASSAKTIGHPLADGMLADVTEILDTKFWEAKHGAIAEEFAQDWSLIDGGSYRGQNSNMHLTEALMAAFEVTGERAYLDKAESIADLVIRRSAGSVGWRVAEHFNADWVLDKNYRGNEMFRPSGTTPGHWLEWARLLLQLWSLGKRRHDWMPDAAKGLFSQSMSLGWDNDKGGFFYTLDWEDIPAKRNKLWWPACEGAGAAHYLNEHAPSDFHEESYRKIWSVIGRAFIDHANGGWHEELTDSLVPAHTLFPGKGDIYHALQACLIPLFPATGSLTKVIAEAGGKI
ncbi:MULTISPECIES: AGE family epimerase/isomerase [unclassified Rhizobium]|uniref:AGE family epimerase/isomerase n=1 Tax=unclassified Rhizobium TaxID=2613769 RepID=UPI000DE042F4|nr:MULTISPECIES: AGE family epimerase/isomerase [unclassified Rhizobium]MBB3285810.1 mannose/cellobiose epimerase-like protein (N-acyl-D-glucosamine 2-epimerase family) [Rhizobium sp. BK252]MBB3401028.1 mannose/cellobiose epimerase-like protein (N-acyl-D-glucosamine 2-epimerase family) [Rhizobium sp. BK289]MBB3413128.1 mannose/cellobiose epimerase-like protein (N-acyl-D-glucosamine 2-epimerase family) [Rhizobium sp. BK284]MBB3481494.1 mannose/cellobiose epimerase-like protein (N-acyl-D-glucosam